MNTQIQSFLSFHKDITTFLIRDIDELTKENNKEAVEEIKERFTNYFGIYEDYLRQRRQRFNELKRLYEEQEAQRLISELDKQFYAENNELITFYSEYKDPASFYLSKIRVDGIVYEQKIQPHSSKDEYIAMKIMQKINQQ